MYVMWVNAIQPKPTGMDTKTAIISHTVDETVILYLKNSDQKYYIQWKREFGQMNRTENLCYELEENMYTLKCVSFSLVFQK